MSRDQQVELLLGFQSLLQQKGIPHHAYTPDDLKPLSDFELQELVRSYRDLARTPST